MKENLYGLTRAQLTSQLSSLSEKGRGDVRAAQLFKHIYDDREKINTGNLPVNREILSSLAHQYEFDLPVRIESHEKSTQDGSVKFIVALYDGRRIETVLIPERGRMTLCLSTQVGCAQGCRFCQTGRMGLLRNLTSAEIVAQLVVVQRWRTENELPSEQQKLRITNVVFMGMGEPLDNLNAVIDATDIFTDCKGLNLSPNKITVSTVGLVSELGRLLKETKVSVALSLHSPFDAERTKIMPVNIGSPIGQVTNILRNAAEENLRKSFLIQYTLIRGVNDSTEHAQAIADLLKGIPVKVNLIPLNEHEGAAFRRPDLGRVSAFQNQLKSLGLVTTVRLSKGRDIQAACGQLIKKYEQKISAST